MIVRQSMQNMKDKILNENKKRILSLIGIGRAAGLVSTGYDKAVAAVKTRRSFFLLAANDISEKTKKNLKYETEKENIPIFFPDISMFEMSNALGTKTGIVSVNDKGISRKVREAIGENI